MTNVYPIVIIRTVINVVQTVTNVHHVEALRMFYIMIIVIPNVQKALSIRMVNVVHANQNVNHVMMVRSVHYVKTVLKVYSKVNV